MKPPFRIAAIATEYRQESHADVIISRWLEPHPLDIECGWIPKTTIASLHVMQIPQNDLSHEYANRYGIHQFPTVREALTLGGEDLAVDAILIIGEHGNFPSNALGQKLYPRKELFDQVVEVFQKSNRVVPIFFDKHLSWDPRAVHEMYWRIKEMEIPFFGGSSISFAPLSQPLVMENMCRPREMMAIYWNCLEPYLFHSLELAQTLLENRAGGETGVQTIIGWKGEDVWAALDRNEFSMELLEAAAGSVSQESIQQIQRLRAERDPTVYANQLIYADGMKVTHFMQNFTIRKWCLAYDTSTAGDPPSAYAKTGGRDGFFNHFARLNCQTQDFFLSGKSPVSLDRLYFTSMATAACMQALATPNRFIATPTLQMPPPRDFPE